MRPVPAPILDTIGSTDPTARVRFHAWYDGALTIPDLEVSRWSIQWDGSDRAVVQGKLDLTVADPDGALSPWSWDDPLAPGGARIQAVYEAAGESVPLGWYIVTKADPEESWRAAGPSLVWVAGGGSVPVSGEELTRLGADDRLWAPEAPATGGTLVSEVTRLLRDVCPVIVAPGVVDRPVPSSMVYDKTRGDHAHDLITSYGYGHRMTGDGALEIIPTAQTTPVWTVAGRGGGALVRVKRSMTRDDVLNGVASTSNDPSTEIRQIATLNHGPLRYGGPAGRRIMEHTALANTAGGVLQDAETYLANKLATRSLTLAVTCAPHPGVQPGDWVRVAHPMLNRTEYPLDGAVTAVNLSGSTAGVDAMQLGVDVPAAAAATVAQYVRRNRP